VWWAACGKNRADGRITAPSAVNAQDVMVFVCRSDGAYLYDGQKNTLTLVSSKDLRKAIAGRQSFAATAPVALVLVSDLNKLPQGNKMLGAMDAGYVSENICLACTALGLATVPRATMDHTVLTRELQLTENQELMLNNPIGYPAE
jgi:nitroreductase